MSKRVKKLTVTHFKKLCDREMSLLVRSIGHCEKCGAIEGLSHAHVIPRTNFALRYDPINALCLCFYCHIYWAHKNPLEFTWWFQDKYPNRYEYLQHYRNEIKKRTLADWEELLDNLKNRRIEKLHYI